MAFWNVGKKQPVGQPDEPAVVDEFEIHDYIGGLAEFIEECNTPLTLSIQGSWGTGKTSIMNLVNNRLKEDNAAKGERIIPIWFNTWQFSQFNMSEQLPISLINSLINKLDVKDSAIKDKTQKVMKGLRYCYLIGKAASIAALELSGAGITAETLKKASEGAESTVNELNQSDPSISIENLKKTFTDCITKKLEERNIDREKGRIVIFIDDLDRLNPGKAVELLEVLKLFLDCKNCVFVLAIDYDVVCRGVEIKYGSLADNKTASAEKGKSFFDKIIQVPFKMPIARYNIQKYVTNCFKQIGITFANENEANIYIDLIKRSIGTNPRSMKRLFNAFQLLLKIVPKEKIAKSQDQQLLFAILCLQHCSESIYSFTIRNLDSLNYDMFKLIVDADFDGFTKLTEEMGIDSEDLSEDDFKAAQPFMEKLKRAIDLDDNNDIDEKEFENFKEIMDFSAITNATDIDKSQTVKKGSQIVDEKDIELVGNSAEDVKHIVEMIKRISEDIAIQFIQPNNSNDCIRGKVNGNKTIIDVYGHSKGYAFWLSAPNEETLRDELAHPDIIQLMNIMGVKPGEKSYRKAVRISVFRGETKTETEENIIKLGKLIYNEWKK